MPLIGAGFGSRWSTPVVAIQSVWVWSEPNTGYWVRWSSDRIRVESC